MGNGGRGVGAFRASSVAWVPGEGHETTERGCGVPDVSGMMSPAWASGLREGLWGGPGRWGLSVGSRGFPRGVWFLLCWVGYRSNGASIARSVEESRVSGVGFWEDLVGDDKSDGLEGRGLPPARTRSTSLRACFDRLSTSGPTARGGQARDLPLRRRERGQEGRVVCATGGDGGWRGVRVSRFLPAQERRWGWVGMR